MIVERSEYSKKIVIDLSGPDGNGFCLIGLAKTLAHKAGMSTEESLNIQNEMMNGDYDNLIRTLDMHFGKYLVLINH